MQRQLNETDAGQTLYGVLESLVKKQQKTLAEIRSERKRHADESVLKLLQDEYDAVQAELETTIGEMQMLKIPVGKRILRHFMHMPY